MTNATLSFDEVLTLALNAMEFEGLMSDDVFDFMVDCGLTESEADECSALLFDEVLAA